VLCGRDRLVRATDEPHSGSRLAPRPSGGVPARFGLQAFAAAQTALPLVLLMLLAYLLARCFVPRYAVPVTLLVAIVFVADPGSTATDDHIGFDLATPVFTAPSVHLAAACISLALPLFVVTMASQNLPGVAAIRPRLRTAACRSQRNHHADRCGDAACWRRSARLH